ncbi:MAG: ATP-binding protein [Chloroflexi bacterium]|nr:ATP-binding protein [Chloroflexota bacterium]
MRIANFYARRTLVFQRLRSSKFLVYLVHHADFTDGWSLIKRFTFQSFIVMLLGTAGIGWWVGEKIKTNVIKESAAATALYMDSFVAPNIQELANSKSITTEHTQALDNLFSENNLGQRTVSVKIWNKDHYIIYSNIPSLVGLTFPNTEDQIDSWHGKVTGEISSLQEAENIEERRLSADPLLEIYSPVQMNDTNQIIAVAEFYQKVDTLEAAIAAAQRRGWLIVGTTMTFTYLLMIGFVRLASNRIGQQELELKTQVAQLTQLLSHNKELARRVRLAAANTAALNESLLRRTSAELHDGPVQEVSLALLRLDRAIDQNETCRLVNPNSKCNDNLPIVQTSLQTALQKMRAIASGLGLPQLDGLTLSEVFFRVVRSHEQRTGTKSTLIMSNLPDQSTLPIKITAYRFIQEALNNAYRHAGGAVQQVRVKCKTNQIQIEVSDKGPGFDVARPIAWEEHIGLAGIRERVESMGGLFRIESKINEGTKVIAILFLQNSGEYAHG